MLAVPLLLLALLSSPEEALQSGMQAMASGNFDDARATFESILQNDPNNPQVWLAMTQLYARMRDDKHRAEAASKATEIAHQVPDWQSQPAIQNYLGKVALATGNLAMAEVLYRAAVQLDPREEAYRFDLAQALLGHERFPEAALVLEDAQKVFPGSAQIELALGVAYYGQRRFPQAVDAFLRTIQLDDSIAQPYVFLGKMLDQTADRLPEVTHRLAAFEKAHPDDYLAPLLLAKALIASGGDTSQAEALLRRSIALQPSGWESHYELGVLLEGRRRFDDAATELESSVKLNPEIAATHYHLARVDDRLGRASAAAEQRELHQKLTARDKITAGMEPVR